MINLTLNSAQEKANIRYQPGPEMHQISPLNTHHSHYHNIFNLNKVSHKHTNNLYQEIVWNCQFHLLVLNACSDLEIKSRSLKLQNLRHIILVGLWENTNIKLRFSFDAQQHRITFFMRVKKCMQAEHKHVAIQCFFSFSVQFQETTNSSFYWT